MEALVAVTQLAVDMHGRHTLDALLQLIADRTAAILGTSRTSIRLLNPGRTHLLAVARAGVPLHDRPQEFRLGEGLVGHVAETGAVLRTSQPEKHPSYVARPGMSAPLGAFLGVPIRTGTHVMGVLSAVDPERAFTEEHERLLVLVAALCAPYVEMARLTRLAHADPLTGALNRRGLDDAFPEAASASATAPLSVVLADIDHFKSINDTHGHAIGDLVLKHVTNLLGGVVRAGDAVVRYGGEEILLVLPGVTRAHAEVVAERARLAVRMTPLRAPLSVVHVTVSLGVAERREGESRDGVITRADKALYRAKDQGRDRVIAA